MSLSSLRSAAALLAAVVLAGVGSPTYAQAPADNKTAEPKADNKSEAAHLADVARQVQGAAGYPECAHLGENAISLMMRNDLDTAFRHIDLYDRFGCPGAHVQTSFRCALRIGMPVSKDGTSLESLVRSCWVNPAATSVAPATAAAPAAPATPPATAGTGAR
jgi:hypothetical protein